MPKQLKINGLPVFNALVTSDDTGMEKISLVDRPAVESDFLAFSAQDKQAPQPLYFIEDEEKRLVLGVVMRAEFPIYRKNKELGEFYIVYHADTIRLMAQKYLAEGRQNNVNLQHKEGSDVEGVEMVQYFFKDTAKGIAPSQFDKIEEGSLFAEFHVENDDVWEKIKDGTYKGFSLEGYFDLQPEIESPEAMSLASQIRNFGINLKSNNMNKVKKFLAALADYFATFASTTTDKGVIYWDGDEAIAVGNAVSVKNEAGEDVPAEDGDYKLEDGRTVKVVDGKVSEIVDAVKAAEQTEGNEGKGKEGTEGAGASEPAKPAEPAPAAPADPAPAEPADPAGTTVKAEDETSKRLDRLEKLMERVCDWMGIVVVEAGVQMPDKLQTSLAAIRADIDVLKKTPVGKPAHEEFNAHTGESGSTYLERVMSAQR